MRDSLGPVSQSVILSHISPSARAALRSTRNHRYAASCPSPAADGLSAWILHSILYIVRAVAPRIPDTPPTPTILHVFPLHAPPSPASDRTDNDVLPVAVVDVLAWVSPTQLLVVYHFDFLADPQKKSQNRSGNRAHGPAPVSLTLPRHLIRVFQLLPSPILSSPVSICLAADDGDDIREPPKSFFQPAVPSHLPRVLSFFYQPTATTDDGTLTLLTESHLFRVAKVLSIAAASAPVSKDSSPPVAHRTRILLGSPVCNLLRQCECAVLLSPFSVLSVQNSTVRVDSFDLHPAGAVGLGACVGQTETATRSREWLLGVDHGQAVSIQLSPQADALHDSSNRKMHGLSWTVTVLFEGRVAVDAKAASEDIVPCNILQHLMNLNPSAAESPAPGGGAIVSLTVQQMRSAATASMATDSSEVRFRQSDGWDIVSSAISIHALVGDSQTSMIAGGLTPALGSAGDGLGSAVLSSGTRNIFLPSTLSAAFCGKQGLMALYSNQSAPKLGLVTLQEAGMRSTSSTGGSGFCCQEWGLQGRLQSVLSHCVVHSPEGPVLCIAGTALRLHDGADSDVDGTSNQRGPQRDTVLLAVVPAAAAAAAADEKSASTADLLVEQRLSSMQTQLDRIEGKVDAILQLLRAPAH